LQAAITASGLSQNQIAKATGVHQQNINLFMAGKQGISFRTAAVLCAFLGLQLVKTSIK
jgi:plasmid maintenance system antidote protein VapI